MAPTDPNRLAVTPGTFQHVSAATALINDFVSAQRRASSRVEAAQNLPGLFDGPGGALTRGHVAGVPRAVVAAGNVGNELRAMFMAAENALAEFRDADALGARLIASACAVSGDPGTLSQLLYPDDKTYQSRADAAQHQAALLKRLQEELEKEALAKASKNRP